MRMRTTIALLIATGLTAACATTSDPSYIDGRRLIAAGQVEDGLALLDKAANDNPRRPELRMEYVRQREIAVGRFLQQGESARLNGQLDEAAAAYTRALRI